MHKFNLELRENHVISIDPKNFTEDFNKLLTNELLLIVLNTSYDKTLCDDLSDRIEGKHECTAYQINEVTDNVTKTGISYSECKNNPDMSRKYFDLASEYNESMRSACFPYLSPLDYVQSFMDRNYVSGCKVAVSEGRKLRAGNIRRFGSSVIVEPHQDIPHLHCPNSDFVQKIKANIACNFFLNPGDDGGELCLWNRQPNGEEFDKMRDPDPKNCFAYQRGLIGKHDLSYKPTTGQVMLFNTANIHSVEEVNSNNNTRSTLSFFLAYCGKNEPLNIYA
jgi:hypothetical protein